jgi:hypothetical protein
MILINKLFIQLLLLCSINIAGCRMEHAPASFNKTNIVSPISLPKCSFFAFPETNTSLLPKIQLIDCVVENDLAPEIVELEFIKKNGETLGKQTEKSITTVNLSTNEYGAMYYLHYTESNGVQDCLGRWCCWNADSENAPSFEKLLPDELNAVHIKSDGGMLFRASWNVHKKQKGLALILCGLGGMQHSSKVLGKELLQEGWAVAYLYTVLNVPEYKMKVALKNDNPVASAIDIFDSKYCQVIAATKAIRSRMEMQLPELINKPLALIGISAGALNTPAVYHELQDEVDAVVLIAGGANMFDIVQDGAFTNWKFTNSDGNTFSRDELDAINNEYLTTPSRDPYFLAPRLPHKETLILHAKWDAVVPAKNGDLLWERAGKPERWVYPSGHLGLFMTFEWHADDVVRWLDSKIN